MNTALLTDQLQDNTPSNAVLQQRIFEAQRAALEAKNVHNYTQAKLSAEAARSDSQTMYSRSVTLKNVGGNVARYGTRERRDEHRLMQQYVECTDALYNAIKSHELGHTMKFAAQAATQDPSENTNFQEIAITCRDVVSSQHANSPWGQLLDPSISLMISGLAVPCADALMLESIAHYEHYHLHAKQFDHAVFVIASGLSVYPLPGALPVNYLQIHEEQEARREVHVHYALRIDDERGDAKAMHWMRIKNISPAQQHPYDLAVREWLVSVSHEFTPEQLAHFATKSTLRDAFDDRSTTEIAAALENVVINRARTHYVAAKQDLELRNIEDCDRNARLAIEAFNLSVHCCRARFSSGVCLMRAVSMHMTKMLLSLNDQLRLAQAQEVLAQCAADMGDPVRTTLYTGKATEHLDHHDVILKLVNPMLLEKYEKSVNNLPHGAPDVWMQHWMQEIESTEGPVSTTVRERVRNENILQAGRRNMLCMGAENLRRSLSHQMRSDDIYDATEGIPAAVLQ